MRRTLAALACLSLLAAAAPAAAAAGPYKLDAAGKCRDAKGAFAKADLCKTATAAPAGKCRDKTTKKFAKCGAPNTEPVPSKK